MLTDVDGRSAVAKHNVETGINRSQLKHLGRFASPAVLEAGHNVLTAAKAKEILRDDSAQGQPLTAKQKRFFGAIAGGETPRR